MIVSSLEDVSGQAQTRYDFIDANGNRTLGIDITLNSALQNASNEFIVSTILHEALHSYFIYRNSIGGLDHTLMAQQYIDWFKSIMTTLFPNIDNDTNTALAWGGLEETSGWAAKSDIEKNHIVGINNEHKSGIVGQKCP